MFVVLGHCQYEKNGYQNRFNVGDEWHTMSTYRGMSRIIDKEYVNPEKDWAKITDKFPKLRMFDRYISESLYETNIQIISKSLNLLAIDTKIVSDYPTDRDWETCL